VLLGQGGASSESAIYDVTDPVHPRLLCRIQNTTASLSSAINYEYLFPRSAIETDLVVRWYADANETPAGKVFGWVTSGTWLPGGSLGAFTVPVDSSDQYPAGGQQVWTYERGTSKLLFTYGNGIGDCVCRFGLPGPLLPGEFWPNS